jgi:Protein kinase domain
VGECPRCGGQHDLLDCPSRPEESDTLTAGIPAAPPGSATPITGLLAGRYRIVEPIGRGGMGEVYHAHDQKLDVAVALKFLPVVLERDPERLARLLNEVRVARQVSHPNVCRVYDVAESEGRHFLTMELIEGETLGQRLARKGSLPYDEALSLARQTCLGLAAAHERGVLHRDLKPSNVMVDERGVARITDFGLAEAAPEITGGRAREGTPHYMAPEALEGGRVTAKSDLFSLGLLLREIFTAGPAHDPHPRVAAILRRCLETDPASRPASARAVAEALPGGRTSLAGVQAAQRRADRIAAFRAELRELRAAGVAHLDPAGDEAIAAHHDGVLRDLVRDFDVDVGEREKQLSLGMRVVSVLGAVALAASTFYFFNRIWGLMSFPAQVAVLVGAPLFGLALCSVVAARDRSGHFAAMAAAFAFACFAADLSVLGVVLNVRPTPYVWLAWGAFALVLAYGHRLRLPLAIGVFCLGAFAAAMLPDALGFDWSTFMERPEGFLPFGLLVFVAPSYGVARRYPPFASVYRLLGVFLVLWSLLLLSLNARGSFLPVAPGTAKLVYEWTGLAASATAIAIGVARRFPETVYCGFSFFVVHLFVRCFGWWWDWMPRYLFFLILAAVAVAVLWGLRRLRSHMSLGDEPVRP